MIRQVQQSAFFDTGFEQRPGIGNEAGAVSSGSDFHSMIAGLAKNSIEVIREGEQAAAAGIRGQAPIQEVVEKVMAAEQSLQAALAVREKVVSAWLEISRMNI